MQTSQHLAQTPPPLLPGSASLQQAPCLSCPKGTSQENQLTYQARMPALFLDDFMPSGNWALMPEPQFLNLSNVSSAEP